MLAGLVLLGVEAGSFSFEQLAHTGPDLSSAVRGVCFGLLFVGFAVKAALIPLQTWLPGAYGETDADSSGFVAAVSLNVAFYAMLRVWFGFLGHPAVWWAVVALLVGALTALIGILGGVLQREFRLFVAYSSIENSGLIVTDLGLALMGKAQHRPGLIGVGLVAAAFQITAHSIAKGGLFAAVAAVEHSTGTSDMERLGGLYRRLPDGGDRDAVRRRGARGAAAVQRLRVRVARPRGVDAGLPGQRHRLAPGDRAGGCAGRADRRPGRARLRTRHRDDVPRHAARPIDPAAAGGEAGAVGDGPARARLARRRRCRAMGGQGARARPVARRGSDRDRPHQPARLADRARICGLRQHQPDVLALTLTGFALGAAGLRYLASLRRARRVPVWASGVAVSGRRVQYTPIGYANMVRVIFNVVYRVRTQLRSIGDQRFPERLSMIRAEPRLFDPGWLYRPITGAFTRAAELVRNIQAGPLGLYLLYLLLAFIALLLIAPRLG